MSAFTITYLIHIFQIKAVSVLQEEGVKKEKALAEAKETTRLLKEKLQMTSEQMMILQANFADMESQNKKEIARFEVRLKDTIEKHETEVCFIQF